MNTIFKFYIGKSLGPSGYPCLIISEQIVTGSSYTVEWMAFISGAEMSCHKMGNISITIEPNDPFELSELDEIAFQDGEAAVLDLIGDAHGDLYRMFLAANGYELEETQPIQLVRLHHRSLFSDYQENWIIAETNSRSIKEFISSIHASPRIVVRRV